MRRLRRYSWLGGLFTGLVVLASTLLLVQPTPPPEAPRIAVVDSDALRYELGGTWATFKWGLRWAGARPVVLEHEAAGAPRIDEDRVRTLMAGFDGLLLGGGKDVQPELYGGDASKAAAVDPQRDRFELALLSAARSRDMPVLGVCRGVQIMNVFLGGTLRTLRDDEALRDRHYGLFAHDVTILRPSRLAFAYDAGRLEARPSFHGQAVDRLGHGLRVTARGPGGVVEGVETTREPLWWVGVQWHPELPPLWGAQSKVFRAFVERAKGYRRERRLQRAGANSFLLPEPAMVLPPAMPFR